MTNAALKLKLSSAQLWDLVCREDLTAWAIRALAPMRQTPARHHQLLLNHLTKVATGEIDRLMVTMPPGHAKSTYSSVLFPAWFFGQRPNLDIIGASHGDELAKEFSSRIQDLIRRYPQVLGYGLRSENVAAWKTTNGGNYRAAGVGGSITGRRSDLTIIDDPIKGQADAESQTVRDTAWNWYQAEVYTRQKPGSRIIVILTRWNEDDPAGRLLQAQEAGGDKWTLLKLPALCDLIDDPLGRPIGAALWPAWQDEAALARVRANVGPYVWGALYQQDPKPRGASFFDIDDLLVDGGLVDVYGHPVKVPVPLPTRCDTIFCCIDTAIKTGAHHNSTGVTYFSYNRLTQPTTTLVLDWDIVQIEGAKQSDWLPSVFARGEELARLCGARNGFSGAMIEDRATGTVLLQQSENLRNQGKHSPAYAIDSKLTAMGKDERAIAAAPYVIAQGVKLTEPAWNKTTVHKGRSANHLVSQVSEFRLARKGDPADDLLDTFLYGVLATHGSTSGDRKGI
jgi:hypothetical protein